MNRVILTVAFGAAFAMTSASAFAAEATCVAPAGHAVLAVTVNNVRSNKGEVAITVYPGDSKLFLAPHAKLARARLPAAPVIHACLDVPKAGDYAIAIYHDENGDHHFNRTLVGLPAEGYGFSNDAPAVAGLPTYSASKFTAHEGVNPLTITMRY